MPELSRGEVWLANLSPTKGHETRGTRPCLIVSVDPFNRGPAGLVVVLPITTREKGIPLHVAVNPPEGGLEKRSFVKCEEPRSISKDRLTRRLGELDAPTMEEVDDRLRIVLGL